MAGKTIVLTRPEISSQIDIAETIPVIENAMGEFEKGEDYLPPKAIYQLPIGDSSVVAMAACITGYTQASDLLSMKVGQERSENSQKDLPTTDSWIAAFDPETGRLLMICDGTLPTMYRTAAAAAVSVKHLSRRESRVLAVVGAGQLGRQCLRAVQTTRPFEKICLHDVRLDVARQVADELNPGSCVPIEVASAEDACGGADVIVTATNSREPIVKNDWVKAGTHLCCMGSDLHEKIECEMTLLPRCRLFADAIEHTLQRGEASQAVEQGVLGKDCYQGSLGQVINGTVSGRTEVSEITMYDGVGIGIQDTTIARAIHDQAVSKNLGTQIEFS